MEEARPSDLVQSTVWSPAQLITWSFLDPMPPDLIQYIISPNLPDSSTTSRLSFAHSTGKT